MVLDPMVRKGKRKEIGRARHGHGLFEAVSQRRQAVRLRMRSQIRAITISAATPMR
jgi:hypothetical protein